MYGNDDINAGVVMDLEVPDERWRRSWQGPERAMKEANTKRVVSAGDGRPSVPYRGSVRQREKDFADDDGLR